MNHTDFETWDLDIIIEDASHYPLANGLKQDVSQTIPVTNGFKNIDQNETELVFLEDSATRLFVLSGESRKSLEAYIRNLTDYLKRDGTNSSHLLEALAYTLFSRRSHFTFRAIFLAASVPGLIDSLNNSRQQIIQAMPTKTYRVAFVFTGQGASWHVSNSWLLLLTSSFRTSSDFKK